MVGGTPRKNTKTQETQYLSDLVLAKLPIIFESIAGTPTSKFDAHQLQRYLQTHFNHKASISSVKEAIWEIDDDHDGQISWDEFSTAITRCIHDTHAREPQQVFNVVLYSVFSNESGVLSEHDLKHLLYLRFGKVAIEEKLATGFRRGPYGIKLEGFIRGMSLCI